MITYRFYNCGCEPDFDHYCKAAVARIWEAQDAKNTWALVDWMATEQNERLVEKISAADRWVIEHLRAQNEAGAYTDVAGEDPHVLGCNPNS